MNKTPLGREGFEANAAIGTLRHDTQRANKGNHSVLEHRSGTGVQNQCCSSRIRVMPPRRATPVGYQHARTLRKRQTPAEGRLWVYLRDGRLQGVAFRRQHAIGPSVTDFCAPRHRLVIELDGSPHLQQEEQDVQRTEFLVSQGYRVLRFWNNDVMTNMDGVVTAILDALQLA